MGTSTSPLSTAASSAPERSTRLRRAALRPCCTPSVPTTPSAPAHRRTSAPALGAGAPARSRVFLHPLLALVGIRVGAVLDEHRRGEQVVGLAEHVGEIARIGIRHRGGLGPPWCA